jgi:hypothetical protein
MDLKYLQALLLQLQYVMYNPKAGSEISSKAHCYRFQLTLDLGVWDITGAVVRTAVDLGLNHEPSVSVSSVRSPLETDMRRRLFWV